MHAPVRELRFGAFTLDLLRCVVRRGNEELPLRPQSFDVLRYLAERPGRIVSKEELFAAIWPGVTVTDDSLVQCVRDIRQALGDSSRQIVKAVPKRGYLLQPPLPEDAAGAATAQASRPPPQLLPKEEPVRVFGPGKLGRRDGVPRAFAAGLLIIALAGVLVAADSRRQPPPSASAAHYAVLARAVLTAERNPKAHSEALALLEKALALDSNNVPALLGYARVLTVDVLERWAPPDEARARLALAEKAIERAGRLDPANARVHHQRGSLLRARGDWEGAAQAYERALAMNPNNAWAIAELGRAKMEFGRASETIADIERAIRLLPTDVGRYVWYVWAGQAAVHLGDGAGALHWLLKAREARPGYRVPLLWLAVAYADLGREEEGRAQVAELLSLSPGFTLSTWSEGYPRRTGAVAGQRGRIMEVLRRLGLPEGAVTTGSLR